MEAKEGKKRRIMRRRISPFFITLHLVSLIATLNKSFVSCSSQAFQHQQQQQLNLQLNSTSATPTTTNSPSIIIDQQSFSGAQLLRPASNSQANGDHQTTQPRIVQHPIGAHLQPSFVYGARNRSINFTHILVDELTNSIYVGATNWLFQLSALNLAPEFVLKTGPGTSEKSAECAAADLCAAQISHIEPSSLPMHHHSFLQSPSTSSGSSFDLASLAPALMRQTAADPHSTNSFRFRGPSSQNHSSSLGNKFSTRQQQQQQQQQQSQSLIHNNYNKLLVIEPESRQLIQCGSLNQGACRKHQLGQLSNFSELIAQPVVSNDEHSSSVALITTSSSSLPVASSSSNKQRPIMYVAATKSRIGPYREMVPAISARHLEPASRAMQIIEKSFTDMALVDIEYTLRDYYTVNYLYSFQHGEFIYFATVQRKSYSRQLEELGYITRLARLCSSDLSFQSYIEITLECSTTIGSGNGKNKFDKNNNSSSSNLVNYNLLQDAQLISAGSHLAQALNLRWPQSNAVLATVFAQSKDHTTKSQPKSAICLYPIERIEAKFNENIHLCYNGTAKARNMNYIAGSVDECPKPGKAGNIANFCNEPIKLNGSLPLIAQPILTYQNELLTAISSTLAPTSPINLSGNNQQSHSQANKQSWPSSSRQHQVLIAGTNEGALKRINVVSASQNNALKGVEFDSIQVGQEQEPILADLSLFPSQVNGPNQEDQQQKLQQHQFAIVATPHKVAKLRINSCKAPLHKHGKSQNISAHYLADDCQSCAQLQDPFCGWCASSGSCLTRDDCLQHSLMAAATITGGATTTSTGRSLLAHWSPFDQIKCHDYQPLVPQFVALQTTNHLAIEVNIRLSSSSPSTSTQRSKLQPSLALQLAQAQFACHFDYLANSNRTAPAPRLSGASTRATQARLNLHTSTVVVGCPLPAGSQRPQQIAGGTSDQLQTKLSVRLLNPAVAGQQQNEQVNLGQVLGMKPASAGAKQAHDQQQQQLEQDVQVERELTLYDCSIHTSCRTCLTSGRTTTQPGSSKRQQQNWSCSWCPLSQRCTFNASHPDFGCAASAIISTTTPTSHSAFLVTPTSSQNNLNSNFVRASHLTSSLDRAQASVFGMSIDSLNECSSLAGEDQVEVEESSSANERTTQQSVTPVISSQEQQQQAEILVPSHLRRSIRVTLRQQSAALGDGLSMQMKRGAKLECQLEIEGAKGRVAARLLEPATVSSQLVVVCQESVFSYQEERATQRAQLQVVLNENQVIDKFTVILYKCHLFGVSPPALTSTIGLTSAAAGQSSSPNLMGGNQHSSSSAAWRAHELLHLAAPSTDSFHHQLSARSASSSSSSSNAHSSQWWLNNNPAAGNSGDCSLCLNVERKYQCAWCANQCLHSDQCQQQDQLQDSTCPPPRIDSIHPTSGPLEGGTLLTIEGSNLGSNEREIQDKITLGGQTCQLVMYSVSTRIVCKTGPSAKGAQSATVFVGNRAGISSAHEKFHYKAVHLTDVQPHFGPVSGGTRLYLSGSNLNIGSRVQIFLDEIPCALDGNGDITSNQISCITAPNLVASSMRITRLTLMIDNSTHYLPYPFTYQPDPIITNIEPAESFISGGRLIMITGQHLASPQSTKLMVYHEHKHNIINGTSCITLNDTLITCLTPAISSDLLNANLINGIPPTTTTTTTSSAQLEDAQATMTHHTDDSSLSYESGGLKLKMSLFMDDVKSVRNLDEYYHHLPHYLTYFEDPQLFRLATPIVDYTEELVISGENLKMKQLDQDMLITIGSHVNACLIRQMSANQVVCEPPKKVTPVYDENGRLIDRPLLPIVAHIGQNLRFQLGHMQYSSSQYQVMTTQNSPTSSIFDLTSTANSFGSGNSLLLHPPANMISGGSAQASEQGFGSTTSSVVNSISVAILVALSVVGFIVGLGASFMFALSKYKHSKAEREYKRIQLQMGSLDINGQPLNGALFDTIHINSNSTTSPQHHHHHLLQQQHLQHPQSVHSRAMNYVGGAFSGKKLFYQFNNQAQLPSFPPSPLTDISSLTGSNLINAQQHNGNQQQQHIVKLSSNGTIVNSTQHTATNQHQQQTHIYNSATSNSSSSQSSPGSIRNSHDHQLFNHKNSFLQQSQQNHSLNLNPDKSAIINSNNSNGNGQSQNSRNFNWTQEAPSTIVPYAVIEACNLTLEGKNAIKDYV